jgi:MOSC domain-containing protein YiiM
MTGHIVSINVSGKKGVRKTPVGEAVVRANFGIEGDAHASDKWHRQVSLLAAESIRKMRDKGLAVGPGDFAENITTEGIKLVDLPVGTPVAIGEDVEAEVSQIGKLCHSRCAIYEAAGDCVMPREGIFVKILKGGSIRVGDEVKAVP